MTSQVTILIDILKTKISNIEAILSPEYDGPKITGSVTTVEYVPLGQQRLRTVELVLKMI